MPVVECELNTFSFRPFTPTALTMDWVPWCTAGVPASADTVPMVTPNTSINLTTHFLAARRGKGTTGFVRLVTDIAAVISINLEISIFGYNNETQGFELIKSVAGLDTITIPTASTDVTRPGGLFKHSTVNREVTAFDCHSCDQFAFAVKTPVSGTGTYANSFLEIKWA